jgi:hypothetical protein
VTKAGRDEILARIRTATGAPQRSDAARKALEMRMKATPVGPHPAASHDPIEHFMIKARANLLKIDRIASLQMLVSVVRDLVSELGATPDISIAPALADLRWPGDWTINSGPGRKIERLSATMAVAGIAETGSVVLCSDPDSPTSLNFLPDVHVVVLRTSDIVSHAEDVWDRIVKGGKDWPRTVNMIAGPSRTADVGGIIVRPAHGPKDVHLVLVEDRDENPSDHLARAERRDVLL